MSTRFAFVTADNDAVTLGDPRYEHLRLAPVGVEFCSGAHQVREPIPWSAITTVEADAPIARIRPPGWALLAVTTAIGVLGIDIEPPVVGITVTIGSSTGRMPPSQDFACTGGIGRGYQRTHCEAIRAALQLFVRNERARALLHDPDAAVRWMRSASAL